MLLQLIPSKESTRFFYEEADHPYSPLCNAALHSSIELLRLLFLSCPPKRNSRGSAAESLRINAPLPSAGLQGEAGALDGLVPADLTAGRGGEALPLGAGEAAFVAAGGGSGGNESPARGPGPDVGGAHRPLFPGWTGAGREGALTGSTA